MHDCFAVTTPGIETFLCAESLALGLDARVSEPGGVAFGASDAQLADALVRLRTANRVLVRVASFRARTFPELERHAATVDWARWLGAASAVHFRVTAKKSRLYHEGGIAERLERVVTAGSPRLVAVRGAQEAETMEEDVTQVPALQRFVVRNHRDDFTISADASGALLYKRGWRQAVAKAPLRESLAAALLLASGWTVDEPLLDPFCGSGTVAIEAALMVRRIAPGLSRRFAMERWPSVVRGAVDEARLRAKSDVRECSVSISGRDRDTGAIEAAISNAERAGVAADVNFERGTVSTLSPDGGSGWVVTNPPYGARIGERDALRSLYASLGTVTRERRPLWNIAMLSADRVLEGQLGVRLKETLKTENGGIAVRVVRT